MTEAEHRERPDTIPGFEDETVRDEQGIEISKHGRDYGTPELRKTGQVYETVVVEGDERRTVRRTSDLMRRMLKSGLITPDEAAAGRKFRAEFDVANLDPVRALPLERVIGTGRGDISDRTMNARNSIAAAMEALGGHGNISGQCAWWVLGCGMSVEQWCSLKIFGSGRSVSSKHASGIVMGTVGLLAKHYGMEK